MPISIKANAKELLGRELKTVHSDIATEYFSNKTVLVTGAGGSIGSEIVRQLHSMKAKRVICLDRDEYSLYNLELSLHNRALLTDKDLVLADIQNKINLNRIMQETKPDVVFHAAAVKHLPLLEKSPQIGFMTNTIGSRNVIEAAIKAKVKRVVNVSTDKAADPSSILGYTKRMAEMIAAHYSSSETLIASVRFGNVFASRGSFIETLQWQIENNQPITITDRDATRFFMSIPQAAGLVIETSVIADPGCTYVLEMGTSVKIVDIVEKYVDLLKAPKPQIKFTGLRKGEKLHEVLYDRSEKYENTSNSAIYSVRVYQGDSSFLDKIQQLEDQINEGLLDIEELEGQLKELSANIKPEA